MTGTSRIRALVFAVAMALSTSVIAGPGPIRAAPASAAAAPGSLPGSLDDAQHLFYSGHYEAASAMALAISASDAENLSAIELRTSAILFQLKRSIGEPEDRDKAFKQCAACPDLMTAFLADVARGRTLALARVATNADDQTGMFFLGKLDLNYVWLQSGVLAKKSGWNEYWEARKSLDAVLKANPGHVRARVARAWIDYIVDTKMPRGFRWILGGGNKKGALLTVRQAADAETDFFAKTEAGFGLWDMQSREKDYANAVITARRLARDFPENMELTKFLLAHGSAGTTR